MCAISGEKDQFGKRGTPDKLFLPLLIFPGKKGTIINKSPPPLFSGQTPLLLSPVVTNVLICAVNHQHTQGAGGKGQKLGKLCFVPG